jgi:hypothetical protein
MRFCLSNISAQNKPVFRMGRQAFERNAIDGVSEVQVTDGIELHRTPQL